MISFWYLQYYLCMLASFWFLAIHVHVYNCLYWLLYVSLFLVIPHFIVLLYFKFLVNIAIFLISPMYIFRLAARSLTSRWTAPLTTCAVRHGTCANSSERPSLTTSGNHTHKSPPPDLGTLTFLSCGILVTVLHMTDDSWL